MVKVNGKDLDTAGITIAQLVERQGFERTRVAVELNEEIVPKAAYDSTAVKDGDIVEIVSFVGGG
ncbi:MAG: sulfur carrier protein ThiS [Ruminococcus sp.]|nr:sulfur carrier protein ThiS [Ruminococcus sp.]MBR1752686.1 sulfur carrier protein ThiS [Ruminococcus sp.]